MKQHGTVPAKGRLMGMQFPLMLKGGEYFEKTRFADWTVPRSTDKEKSALSQNSGKSHGLAPDLKRSKAVFSGRSAHRCRIAHILPLLVRLRPGTRIFSDTGIPFSASRKNPPLRRCHTDIRDRTSTAEWTVRKTWICHCKSLSGVAGASLNSSYDLGRPPFQI